MSGNIISDEVINAARGVSPNLGSAANRIARQFGIEILRGVFTPGEKLAREEELLKRFQVSRTVLREAFKILGAKGFVTAKTRVGTTVRESSSWNYFDADVLAWRISAGLDEDLLRTLREARLAVEPFAARLSAERASESDFAEMDAAIGLMREALSDRKLFAEGDLRFHRAVAGSTHNFLLSSFSSVVETALVCSTLLLPLEDESLRSEAVRRHADLRDAIAERDGDRASQLMRDMIAFGGAAAKMTGEHEASSRSSG